MNGIKKHALEEKAAKVRKIRDQIKDWLLDSGVGAFSYKTLIESDYSETGKNEQSNRT